MTDEHSSAEQRLAAAEARLHQLTSEANELTDDTTQPNSTTTTDIATRDDATHRRHSLARRRQRLDDLTGQIDAAQREANDAIRQIESELRNRVRNASAALEPLQREVARLTEGIEAINLYVGRDEHLVAIRGGNPAPADTPIVIRQQVLSMDEETAIHADADGIDATDIDLFDNWLLTDPAHLDQIIPEPKAIVALVARLSDRDYGNPYENIARNTANKITHFLIRNGDRLFRTSISDFTVGTHLVPRSDEFAAMFTTRTYINGELTHVPVEPGSSEWERAEQRADARLRHYMKVALILQGLLDRTSVLHPLPDADISFLTHDSYDAGQVQIITDAEYTLPSGRPSFDDWLTTTNANLAPGQRIVVACRTNEFAEANDYYDDHLRHRHSRLRPDNAEPPATGDLLTISRRDGTEHIAPFDRTDERWGYEHGDHGRWGNWPYQRRASLRIRPTDKFFIAIDNAHVDDIRYYLQSRTNRHRYRTLFPLLHAAITALDTEATLEAPFRELLAHRLDTDPTTVAELVHWWKHANRHHRALVGTDVEGDALAAITAEHTARTRPPAPIDADLIATLRALHPAAVMIARRRDHTITVIEPDQPDHNVFFTDHRYTKTGRPKPDATRRWRTSTRHIAHLEPAWATERWADWDHTARLVDHLTDPELDDLIQRICTDTAEPVAAIQHGTTANTLIAWIHDTRAEPNSETPAHRIPH